MFDILKRELNGKTMGLDGKNLVFCEEKVSLMVERSICTAYNGSFNTAVYSFGNYLRAKRKNDKTLSREGSAMAIKRVIANLPLKCFNKSKNSLATSLYELISQLKSANVTPDTLIKAAEHTTGILQSKLTDIATVFTAYEEFLKERGLEDQSSMLSYLPDIIRNDETLKDADIYIFGFSGFTAETRDIIVTLMEKAKNVTAILPDGENKFVFVGETARWIRNICKNRGISLTEENIKSDYCKVGDEIQKGIFNPLCKRNDKIEGNVFLYSAKTPMQEVERVVGTIKQLVMSGKCRYRDISLIVPDRGQYGHLLKNAFERMQTPFFLDERKFSPTSPLLTLIKSYIDIFKYGLRRRTFIPFVKNPLIQSEKAFADGFEDYLIKYNIDYSSLKKPLYNDDSEEHEKYEEFRKKVIDLLYSGEKKNCGIAICDDIESLLEELDIKNKMEQNSQLLIDFDEREDSAVNTQMYNAVLGILQEMREILADTPMNYAEFGRVFESGINALVLSILPQYNDAVFVGGFAEAARGRAKYLFAIGLTADVPTVKSDTSLLTDNDIDCLADIKVLIDPKIKVVNHREREHVALGLSAFSDSLFVSYPIADLGGDKKAKSEIVTFLENNFVTKNFPETDDYLTKSQGVRSFAYDCGRFIEGKLNDFTEASSYYVATNDNLAKDILAHIGNELKIRLKSDTRMLIKDTLSPTAIEEFYKCPYRFFVKYGLGVKEKESGEVDGLKSGNLAHEIFKRFLSYADGTGGEEQFIKCFNMAKEESIMKPEYVGFFANEQSSVSLKAMLSECEKYCRKFFKWLSVSEFRTSGKKTEVYFGDGGTYPAISLLNGKVKLTGKIDRIDTYKNYCRIIDYKTGSADASEKFLFSGTKMQLYLYGAAVNDKKVAGLYYIPIKDAFRKSDEKQPPLTIGKTLSDEKILEAQDCNLLKNGESEFISVKKKITKNGEELKNAYDEKTINAFIKYALLMSENVAKEVEEGVIVPSPYENTCDYCGFKAICGQEKPKIREIVSTKWKDNSINGEFILKAVESEEIDTEEEKGTNTQTERNL